MRSSTEIQADLNDILNSDKFEDEHGYKQRQLEYQLQRATLSEEFKKNVLPAFLRTAKECIEKADESFFITLLDGRRFVYYSSKARLVQLLSKGRKGPSQYLPPNKFLRHFIDIQSSEAYADRL